MPKTKAIDSINDDQIVALSNFIKNQGRNWKTALDDAWTNGRYPAGVNSPALQRLRNAHGPSKVFKLQVAAIHAAADEVTAAQADKEYKDANPEPRE